MKQILLTLIIIVSQNTINAQQTGRWGDQGNGTYKNPILQSNYPDNDVIRMGDTFYMMSSTNHFVPGMVLLKSKDLVNWEFSNHIMNAPVDYDENFSITQERKLTSRGNWAGSFGYNGEEYFAYWCYNKRNIKPGGTHIIVYSKAKTMEGPWSIPKEITWANGSHINTTDPGVFWDLETKKAWIGLWTHGEVRIYPMTWDGTEILENKGEGILVTNTYQGEAVKIFKFKNRYYVSNVYVEKDAQGNRLRKGAIQRSKSIKGPWEGKLILENGNGTNRNPAQGAFINLENGTSWFLHQLSTGTPQERYMGRPQFLEPVIWKDGWPNVGIDTDGNGIGEVIWQHKKPIQGHAVKAPATDDYFNLPELGMQWNWRFNPDMEKWSLTERPGFLRLKSSVPSSSKNNSLDELPNIIGQRLMGRNNNVMTTKIELSKMVFGQEIGFHISSQQNNAIALKKEKSGKLQLLFRSGKNDIPTIQKGKLLDTNVIWFQAKVNDGLATFYYSLDGKKFNQFGQEVRLLFSGFTPNMVGYYSMNSQPKGAIDIDWFTYSYDGPKGASKK
ncbi:glycoside hydrolase family 43 protein [Flavicella sediminum]|uniref:glycoside hydrolase family 43 protein n=1 Tax=Flavicella sediminum TaxID=2585141 RepID=UPI00111D6152|nr:glycoside hydrolase 43 family protein [Flavicella sediminum]